MFVLLFSSRMGAFLLLLVMLLNTTHAPTLPPLSSARAGGFMRAWAVIDVGAILSVTWRKFSPSRWQKSRLQNANLIPHNNFDEQGKENL